MSPECGGIGVKTSGSLRQVSPSSHRFIVQLASRQSVLSRLGEPETAQGMWKTDSTYPGTGRQTHSGLTRLLHSCQFVFLFVCLGFVLLLFPIPW